MRHILSRMIPTLMVACSWSAAVHAEDAKAENAAAPTYRLVYKFEPRQMVHYSVTQQMEIRTQFNGVQDPVAINKSESRKHFVVAATDKEQAGDLELIIDWVHMSLQFGSDPAVEYDSSQPDILPPQFQPIARTIGKCQAKMKFSNTGKMLRIYHAGTTWIPVTNSKANAEVKPDKGDPNQTFLLVLPEKAIAVGEKWKEKFELPVTVEGNLQQNISLMRTYCLESVEQNLATISMQTSVLTPIHEPSISAQLIQRETSGTIEFDIQRGLIKSRSISVNRTVIAPFGAKTAMQAISSYEEKLLDQPLTAQKSETTNTATK